MVDEGPGSHRGSGQRGDLSDVTEGHDRGNEAINENLKGWWGLQLDLIVGGRGGAGKVPVERSLAMAQVAVGKRKRATTGNAFRSKEEKFCD